MARNLWILVIFSLVLLLFLPAVALSYRIGAAGEGVSCRRADTGALMQGRDEPGKLPLFILAADPLDINTATAKELELLPGIGESLAGRILEARAKKGGFESCDELMEIEGIGPARYELFARLICVDAGPAPLGDEQ